MSKLTFSIPIGEDTGATAVSSNNAYYNVPNLGRRLTSAARDWQTNVKDAAWLAWVQMDQSARNTLLLAPWWRLRLDYRLHRRVARRDASGLIKLAEDSTLEALGQDDARVVQVTCRRQYVPKTEPETLTVVLCADDGVEVAR